MTTTAVKILVVDDLQEKLLVYRSVLEDLDVEVIAASSGPEALKHVLQHEFAVILLDVNMPGMDGFETASLIRGRKRCAHTPIIFITAFADDVHALKGYSHGAVDYILSPVSPDILRAKVGVFVQLFRLTQQVREQAERQLARAENEQARLTAMLDNAADFVAQTDGTGRRVQISGRGRQLLGLDDDGSGPEDVALLWPAIVREEARSSWLAAAARDGVWFGETSLLAGDGREVPVSQVILGHKSATGEVESFSIIARDITERRDAELELARHRDRLEELVQARTDELKASLEKLRLADRMAAIGTLAAGLGHDMGNLLLPIRMRLESLERLGLPAGAAEDIAAIKVAGDYLKRLSQGLRLFAMDPAEAGATGQWTSLAPWWLEVQPFLRNALPKTVVLECDLPESLPAVGLPAHRLTQAVFNLVQNAGDALRDRATGVVRISATPGPTGREVVIAIADNGPGMSEEVLHRCMEPFFTTKTRSISTGLGLALVRGAVLSAGGSIEIEAKPGRGSTFRLTVPCRPAGAPASSGEGGRRGGTACVGLGDARLGAYVSSVLRAMAVDVRPGPWRPETDAELLVTDGMGLDEAGIDAFLRGDSRRRAVVLGGAGPADHAGRIVRLEPQPAPWVLRKALADVLADGPATTTQEVRP